MQVGRAVAVQAGARACMLVVWGLLAPWAPLHSPAGVGPRTRSAHTMPPPLPPAVYITLRNDTAFAPNSMRDLEVRVGSSLPSGSGTSSTVDAINVSCVVKSGMLAAQRGQRIKLACPVPCQGRIVTLHLRWGPAGTSSLHMLPNCLMLCTLQSPAHLASPAHLRLGSLVLPAGASMAPSRC